MIFRVTFSNIAQIMFKFFISLYFTDTKFKHNVSDKGSDKEPLSSAICDESLTCSVLERSVQKDNLACHIHHKGIQQPGWRKCLPLVWSITQYQGNVSKYYKQALTCLQILIFLRCCHFEIRIILQSGRLFQNIWHHGKEEFEKLSEKNASGNSVLFKSHLL